MSEPVTPTLPMLRGWLSEIDVEYELCDYCDGIHIVQLQDLQGVVDSRIFLEDFGLIFTTALAVRPGALLHVQSDLGPMNVEYPTLKIFLEVLDDSGPNLVVSAQWLLGAGMTPPEFDLFVTATIDATRRFAEESLQLGYLYLDEDGEQIPPPAAFH